MKFPVLIFIGTIFIIIGTLFLIIITVCKKYYDKLYCICTESIVGKFNGFYKKFDTVIKEPIEIYFPVFEYIVNGQPYYCQGNKGAYRKQDVNTEETTIYYNPNNPTESYIGKKTNDIIIKVFSLSGVILLISGLLLIVLKIIFF